MKLLIDGDVIAHRVCARVKDRVDIPELCDQLEAEIEHWARCDPDADIILCLSEGQSFRYWVWPQYKANRPDKEERFPMLDDALYILKHDWYTWAVPGLEGDDCLGILQTSPETGDTCIVTIDKDMQQIPGKHFNPDKDDKIWEQDVATATWWFYCQWLMGDPSDNLPGLPRVGIKTAIKILDGLHEPDEMRAAVAAAYEERGKDETYRRQMEQCVRILTRKDYLD